MVILGLLIIGLCAGLLAGMFGIGGGVLIVPALVYGLGYTQKMATGTSLAILLPPVGIMAVWEYYKHDNVDLRAAFIIAVMLMVGSWLGAHAGVQLNPKTLKMMFGLFLLVLATYIIFDAARM